MQYTTTYRLSKPDYTDIADISVLNANLDIIDQQLADKVTLGTAQTITGKKTIDTELIGMSFGKTYRMYQTEFDKKWCEIIRLKSINTDRYIIDINGAVNNVKTLFQGRIMVDVYDDNKAYAGWIYRTSAHTSGYIYGDNIAIVRNSDSTVSLYWYATRYAGCDFTVSFAREKGIVLNPSTVKMRNEFTPVDLDTLDEKEYQIPYDMEFANVLKATTPTTVSLNDRTVPTMQYLNNPEMATYLVHRAGTETLTGVKTFYSSELAPIRIRRNNVNFDIKKKSADRPNGDYDLFSTHMFDTNNVEIFREYVRMRKDGTYADKWATFYDDNGAVHHPQLGLMTRKSDGLTYAYCTETPADAPNNAIVTKGYSKMVTTDTPQILTGAKHKKASTIDNMTTPSSQQNITWFDFLDKNDAVIGRFKTYHETNGVNSFSIMMAHQGWVQSSSEPDYREPRILFNVSPDKNSYISIPTVPSNAPSSSIVNKAYVESTDGTTNNLVHKTANETITGAKTFSLNSQYVTPVRLQNTTMKRDNYGEIRREISLAFVGADNQYVGGLMFVRMPSGVNSLVARFYDKNGAYHDFTIAKYADTL